MRADTPDPQLGQRDDGEGGPRSEPAPVRRQRSAGRFMTWGVGRKRLHDVALDSKNRGSVLSCSDSSPVDHWAGLCVQCRAGVARRIADQSAFMLIALGSKKKLASRQASRKESGAKPRAVNGFTGRQKRSDTTPE